MQEDGGEQTQPPHPASSETPISDANLDPPSTCPDTSLDPTHSDGSDSDPPSTCPDTALDPTHSDGSDSNPPSTCPDTALDPTHSDGSDSNPPLNQTELFRALEVVERDSLAIAGSFTSLFSSLRLALSEVTSNSVDHMSCFSDAAGRLQESVLDAATKGNRYINSCLRLNEEMKGVENLALQLKILRRNVDALDSGVNRILRLP